MPILGKLYYWGEKAKYIPKKPGVYAFYNKNENLIYIGQSTNLREEFTGYLETCFSNDSCKSEARYYRREFTSNHEERMKELLNAYKQKHGKLPKCNVSTKETSKSTQNEQGFYFYLDIDKPLHRVASNLKAFRDCIAEIPVASLEFHQKRGDFANWIRYTLRKLQLAETIQKIGKTGEDLRKGLLKSLSNSTKTACPKCGVETLPIKTWKMAGRPSKSGERLQLTLGHYKCPNCHKTFRQVLAKEKIKAS